MKYKNLGANCGKRMMYIKSTDIEQKRWDKLLLSFLDEALYFLSIGKRIIIEDKCNKKHGKVERIFAPVMSDFLSHISGGGTKNNNLKHHFAIAMTAFKNNKIIKAKYDFWKKRINNPVIVGKTIFCEKEPTVWR